MTLTYIVRVIMLYRNERETKQIQAKKKQQQTSEARVIFPAFFFFFNGAGCESGCVNKKWNRNGHITSATALFLPCIKPAPCLHLPRCPLPRFSVCVSIVKLLYACSCLYLRVLQESFIVRAVLCTCICIFNLIVTGSIVRPPTLCLNVNCSAWMPLCNRRYISVRVIHSFIHSLMY